jgi:hypothetical protein
LRPWIHSTTPTISSFFILEASIVKLDFGLVRASCHISQSSRYVQLDAG